MQIRGTLVEPDEVLDTIPEISHDGRPATGHKIGIVGLGKMGLLHGAIASLLGCGSLEAVVDTSRFLSTGAGLIMRGTSFFTSLDKMLDKIDPDVVYVTTPVRTHFEILLRLIEHGVKYVFVEKPPTVDSKQLSEIIVANQDKRSMIMVGLQKRYALTFRHAKLLLDHDITRGPLHVVSSIKSNDITRRTSRFDSVGRGVLLDLGIHLVDLLTWMLGIEAVLTARSKSLHTRVDDVFQAVLLDKKANRINLDISWSDPGYRIPETSIHIEGSNFAMTVTEDSLDVTLGEEGSGRIRRKASFQKPHYYGKTPPVNLADPEYTLENLHFYYCIQGNREPLTALTGLERTTKIIDQMYSRAGAEDHV
ncbi:MAG: Gfo/Idh/MocA family oxidoreductase [archaeon]